jgi:hypothetical protein
VIDRQDRDGKLNVDQALDTVHRKLKKNTKGRW